MVVNLGENFVKKLGTAILVLFLTACGGGGDTSSSGGSGTAVGAAPAATDSSGSTEAASSGSSFGSISSSSSSDSVSSGPDGSYIGEITATLSGDGILPVTDSTDLFIEISGTKVTATAEEHSYEGTVDGDSFVVEVPVDENSKGIFCTGSAELQGEISGNKASGTLSGKGTCSSESTKVPVFVTGNFLASK